MRVVPLFVLTFLIATTAFAQPDTLWTRVFPSAGDWCYAALQANDGGYVLAGLGN